MARQLIDDETALAERFGVPRAIAVRGGSALLDRGQAAEHGLRFAADLFSDCGARVELAHSSSSSAARSGGRAAERRRDPSRSDQRRRGIGGAASRPTCSRGADPRWRRAPAHRNRADQLTPSERRVAELSGPTADPTDEIAETKLFVTVKASFRRLGAPCRKNSTSRRAAHRGARSSERR